jgi:hypothetical protein
VVRNFTPRAHPVCFLATLCALVVLGSGRRTVIARTLRWGPENKFDLVYDDNSHGKDRR